MDFGRFCWYDLISLDPEKSLDFLGGLMNVEGKPSPQYTELSVAGQSFGGLMRKPDEQPPSAWVGYILVKSLTDSTHRAEELGARVHMRRIEVPNVGKFAFLEDPEGAFFYLFQASVKLSEPEMKPGMVCWHELHSRNPKVSAQFYGDLLGYKVVDIGGYQMLELNGKNVAGLVPSTERSGWLFYFLVDSVRESAAQVVKLGGTEQKPVTEVPGFGEMAVVADPTGAVFALWEPKMAKVG